MRDRLGMILVAVGLAFMAWPVATWMYGIYWQMRLAQSLPPMSTIVEASPDSGGRKPVPDGDRSSATSKSKKLKKAASPKPSFRFEQTVPSGEAYARLKIDRIDLDAVVVEGTDRFALRRGPGHLPKTGRPGESRNCAIAAHRDAWFQRLHEVQIGDPVWVETKTGLYKYTVEQEKVVTPDRSDLLNHGPKPVLTLITCTGPGYPHSTHRLLVFCRLRGAYSRTGTKQG